MLWSLLPLSDLLPNTSRSTSPAQTARQAVTLPKGSVLPAPKKRKMTNPNDRFQDESRELMDYVEFETYTEKSIRDLKACIGLFTYSHHLLVGLSCRYTVAILCMSTLGTTIWL